MYYSQSFKMIYGDTFELQNALQQEVMLEPVNEGIYFTNNYDPLMIRGVDRKKEMWLNKINEKTGKFEYRINVRDSTGIEKHWKQDYFNVGSVVLGDRILFFSKVKEKIGYKVLMTPFDAGTGKKLAETKPIFDLPTKDIGLLESALLSFTMSVSPDQSKILLVRSLQSDWKTQDVELHVFDSKSLNPIYTTKAPTDFANSTISTFDYRLMNDGSIYYLFGYARTNEWQDYGFGIGYTKDDKSSPKMVAQKENKFWLLVPNLEVHDNAVSFHGYYLETTWHRYDMHVPGGFYDVFFTSDLKPIGESFDRVDKEFNISNSELRVHDQIGTFKIGSDFYVVREHVFLQQEINRYNGHIYVTKVNGKGEFEWHKRVPRCTNRDEVNGILMRADKDLQIIYYENKGNAELYPDLNSYAGKRYKMASHQKESSLISVSVGKDGSLYRYEIAAKGIILPSNHPKNSLQKDNKTFIVKTYDHKSQRAFGLLQAK
jgi:hypothetical protein